MPFSRSFGQYVGHTTKIDEELPPPGAPEAECVACSERVIRRRSDRGAMGVLCNALSMCAFLFAIFTHDGGWEALDDDETLVTTLAHYGIRTTPADLMWFARAFWAPSIDLKVQFGWRPSSAADFSQRVYQALALERPLEALQSLMEMLIGEWKRRAVEMMARFAYEPAWQGVGRAQPRRVRAVTLP